MKHLIIFILLGLSSWAFAQDHHHGHHDHQDHNDHSYDEDSGPMNQQQYIELANRWNRPGTLVVTTPSSDVSTLFSNDASTCDTIVVPAGTSLEFLNVYSQFLDYSSIGKGYARVAYVRFRVPRGTLLVPESWYSSGLIYNNRLLNDCIVGKPYYAIDKNFSGLHLPSGYTD